MSSLKRLLMVACVLLLGVSMAMANGKHRIGAGVNYWTTIDDLELDNIDEDGLAYLLTYQYRPGLIGFGIDVEMLPDYLGEDSYAPQAYLIVGKGIYAAAGVGIVYADSDWADDPFYSVRVGLELDLLDAVVIDLYGNYRFNETSHIGDELEKIDTDTVFLGLAVRLML